MIKQIFLLALISSFMFASMDNFAKKNNYFIDYKKALESSKITKKPLMLIVVTNTCPWCEKLQKQTLTKDLIHNYIATNFTPLILNRDKAQYPTKKFVAKVVPTIFFINSNEEQSIDVSYGYKSHKKFIKVLQNATSKYKEKS